MKYTKCQQFSNRIFLSHTGFDFLKRKRNRRGQSHLDIYKDPTRRIRRASTMAVLAQRVVHDVRSDRRRGEGLQHCGEFHTGPDLEELPTTESRTGFSRFRFPKIRLPRNGEEATFRQR